MKIIGDDIKILKSNLKSFLIFLIPVYVITITVIFVLSVFVQVTFSNYAHILLLEGKEEFIYTLMEISIALAGFIFLAEFVVEGKDKKSIFTNEIRYNLGISCMVLLMAAMSFFVVLGIYHLHSTFTEFRSEFILFEYIIHLTLSACYLLFFLGFVLLLWNVIKIVDILRGIKQEKQKNE